VPSSRPWTELLAEVRANRDLEPSSSEAQALAQRWEELSARTMRRFIRHSPSLKQAIAGQLQQGRFEGHDKAPQAADFAFIERAKAAGKAPRTGGSEN